MQTLKNGLKNSINKLFILIFSSIFIVGGFILGSNAKAADPGDTLTAEDIQAIQDSNCPQSIKNLLNDANLVGGFDDFQPSDVSGTFIQGRDENGKIIIKCATAGDAEKIFIRLIVLVITLVGGVFAFAIGKSAVLMILAFENQESFQEALKSLQTSIGYTIGVFFSYIIVVFILTGVLGLGTNKNHEWNVICGNRIVFQITFGDGDNFNDKCA